MSELNEEQFKLLKMLCYNQVFVVLAPHNLPDDTEEVKMGHIRNTTMFNDLIKQGFMEDANDKFAESLNDLRSKGLRTFDAFSVTELAVKMFSPPEGLSN